MAELPWPPKQRIFVDEESTVISMEESTVISVDAPPKPAKPAARAKRRAERAAPARARSSSRRRRIQNEVRARRSRGADVFALQQRLVGNEASEQLMDAARALLQPSDYEVVTLERAVEGLCGFPSCDRPCSNADVAASGGPAKRWAVNTKDREVYDAKLVGRFCSRDCLRRSGDFKLRLEPEPAYVRTAAAVATSRGAVAEAAEAERAAGSAAEEPPAQVSSCGDASTGQKPLPKVRPKAVVRFSRTKQTYSVAYGDYDGGGALPDLPSPAQLTFLQRENESGEAVPAKATSPKAVTTQQLLAAPVHERDCVARPPPEPSIEVVEDDEPASQRLPAPGDEPTIEEEEWVEPTIEEDECDGEISEGEEQVIDGITLDTGFLDTEPIDAEACEKARPAPGFPRTWGVLTGWMTSQAHQVLDGEPLVQVMEGLRMFEEEPQPAQRRKLLVELLIDRVPGDFTWAAQRLQEVVQTLGLHQVLPPMTDFELYDLLALLLLEGIVLRQAASVAGLKDASVGSAFAASPLEVRVQAAARTLSIGDEELEVLRAIIR